MRYREYHWYHTPSGKMGVNSFNDYHTPYASELGVSEIVALRLVNEWNSGSTDWKYWL